MVKHNVLEFARSLILSAGLAVVAAAAGCGNSNTQADMGNSCATYCTSIMANCAGVNQQYTDTASCLGACAAFPPGTSADKSGNTLGCRIYHAGAAATDATTHCPHAGPGGASVCGTNCEGFCAIAQRTCTGSNVQFQDAAACQTACAAFATTPAYNTAQTSGNSFACRLYHAQVAAASSANANTHCPHIPAASPVCK